MNNNNMSNMLLLFDAVPNESMCVMWIKKNKTMNKTNIKTTLPSCLGKKNLVYVETSNVLQLNTSPSVKRGKDEIFFFS